jgi:hypothetical protein
MPGNKRLEQVSVGNGFRARKRNFCGRETCLYTQGPDFRVVRTQAGNPTSGPVAQCSELAADNRLVGSSSPPSPTTQSYANGDFPVQSE